MRPKLKNKIVNMEVGGVEKESLYKYKHLHVIHIFQNDPYIKCQNTSK